MMMTKMPLKKVHLVGIKGVAMTSLAVYLKEKGYLVAGSDVQEKFSTDPILRKSNIPVFAGFDRNRIKKDLDLVVVTGAHGGATNPQALEAKKLHLPLYMHGRYLGLLMKDKEGIAVSGCHGKTTTSAMIALILKNADFNPSYAIGTAYINELGPAGHYGKGKYFIAEADEYMTCPLTDSTPRFLWLNPEIAVITNIEFDHPDRYRDIEEVKKAYLDFSAKIKEKGILIVCLDDPAVSEMVNKFRSPKVLTYGFTPGADFRIEKIYNFGRSSLIKITSKNLLIGDLIINLSGKHNFANSLAAALVARETGVPWPKIKESLQKYTGCNRRFELINQVENLYLYDDYAHHPTEIKATLAAFKDKYPESQLLVIFQPHTYSRTKILLMDFASAFVKADAVLVTDIFPSAREKIDVSVSSSDLVDRMNRLKKNAYYASNREWTLNFLKNKISASSIIVTMGAGDLNKWHPAILKFMKKL